MDNIMESEEIKTQLIQNSQSLEELKKILDQLKEVRGSHSLYTAQKIKNKIDSLSELALNTSMSELPWNWLTRTYGIRAKCMELFYYEYY